MMTLRGIEKPLPPLAHTSNVISIMNRAVSGAAIRVLNDVASGFYAGWIQSHSLGESEILVKDFMKEFV